MGGMIAVGVRFKDGSVVTHERTTGAIDWWMRDMRVAAGDEDYLRQYLANPVDWDPDMEFGPIGYGMVVVDLVRKRIHEMNDFSSIAVTDSIAHSVFGMKPGLVPKWQAFADAGRIKVTKVAINQEKIDRDAGLGYAEPATAMPEVGSFPSIQEILPIVCQRMDSGVRNVTFEFDLSPMRYSNYYPNLEGTKALRAALAVDGFDVSSCLWDERISHEEAVELEKSIQGDL